MKKTKMKQTNIEPQTDKLPFAQRHPKLNMLLGLVLLIAMIVGAVFILKLIGMGVASFLKWIKSTFSKLDAVIVVALISGAVSIVGIVISKIIEHSTKRKEYLYKQREEPYKKFVEMWYKILDSNKSNENYSQEDMLNDMNEFTEALTLWGSNKVVRLWVKFRLECTDNKSVKNLYIFEKILYGIHKDMGFMKMKKGTLLKIFINDLEEYEKKQKRGGKP